MAPSDRDALYERTLREARAAAALSHPAVVQVYDVVTEAAGRGSSWSCSRRAASRTWSSTTVPLAAARGRQDRHRDARRAGGRPRRRGAAPRRQAGQRADLRDGRCVLTDFGVARMPTDSSSTTPGMVLGSPHFISPERAIGRGSARPATCSPSASRSTRRSRAARRSTAATRSRPCARWSRSRRPRPGAPARSPPVLMGLLEKDPARRWDVETARTVLRELLAGPLASTAPPHMTTDPYAVVWPAPPAAHRPRPAAPAAADRPVGGRAMLAPGESLTDQLARLRRAGLRRSDAEAAATLAADGHAGADPAGGGPTSGAAAAARNGCDAAHATRRLTGAGTSAVQPAASARATLGKSSARPETAGRAPDCARLAAQAQLDRRWRRPGRGADPGLLPAGRRRWRHDPDAPSPAPTRRDRRRDDRARRRTRTAASPCTCPRLGATRRPGAASTTSTRGRKRKVRILVENAAAARRRRFLQIAENNLKKNTAAARPVPAGRAEPDPSSAAGRRQSWSTPAATATSRRHGIWGAVVEGGKAYSFYLTTPEERCSTRASRSSRRWCARSNSPAQLTRRAPARRRPCYQHTMAADTDIDALAATRSWLADDPDPATRAELRRAARRAARHRGRTRRPVRRAADLRHRRAARPACGPGRTG